MVTYDSFVTAFPEFKDQTAYPPDTVNFWIGEAPNMLNACRFGKAYDLAVMLFVAHNLVLGARDQSTTNGGGIPGQVTGPATSKTVGKVSYSQDVGAVTIPGAGDWNATSYGIRLYRMIRAFGAGPVYVGGRGRRFSYPRGIW